MRTMPVYIRAKIETMLICLKPLISLIKDSGKRINRAMGMPYIALYCQVSKNAKLSSGLTPHFFRNLASKVEMMI